MKILQDTQGITCTEKVGEVVVYLSMLTIPSHSLSEYTYINDVLEINTVGITLSTGRNINVVALYMPPIVSDIPLFNFQIGHVLASFHRSVPVYVVGDTNVNLTARCES